MYIDMNVCMCLYMANLSFYPVSVDMYRRILSVLRPLAQYSFDSVFKLS